MTGDPTQEYFSDGISEDIITALSKLRWFFVIARNSSFIYKDKAVHLKQVAEELGVGYVVEGSVRKVSDHVRITAQLNDVATGSHIWAERYDRGIADVFAVQDEITDAIVAAIEPQLYAAENFRAKRKPERLDAWDLVMRALSHYWRVTRQDNVVTQALLEKAISIDPYYGQALGVLATSHTFSAHMGWEDMATRRADRRTRGAGGDPGRQRGPLGAPCARLRLSVHAALRRLAGRVRTGAAAQSELLAGPGLLWLGTLLLRALEGSRSWPRIARCGLARAIRFRRSITASPPTPSSSDAITTRRCACRARAIRQRSDFVGAHRVLTAAAGMAGKTDIASGCTAGTCAARSPIFRSPGSPAKCRSSWKPTGSTIWKASAVQVWASFGLANVGWAPRDTKESQITGIVSFNETPLDIRPYISYMPGTRSFKDAFREGIRECGAGAVAAGGRIRPVPGRLGHHACRYYGRRVRCSLDWDRRRRATPVQTASQEAWPELRPG